MRSQDPLSATRSRRSPTGRVSRTNPSTPWLLGLVAVLVVSPLYAEREETHRFSGNSLEISNLIGEISVSGHQGSDFEVVVRVRGADSGSIPLQIETDNSKRSSLRVAFPVEDLRRFVYPELDRESSSVQIRGYRESGRSWLSELLGSLRGRQIRVTRSGSGEEVWADLEVRMPQGRSLNIEHGVGTVNLTGLEGELDIDVSSGQINGSSLSGDLVFDTGSGSVNLNGIEGDLVVDTGSGAVSLDGFDGPDLSIDTGSGSVDLASVRALDLSVDTGSGGVQGSRLEIDDATVDTGSGPVQLAFVRLGTGDFEVDTGSGGITMLLPRDASASVRADTGSGGVEVDIPDIRIVYKERNEMEFVVGGGAARVSLDTGSGGIRVGLAN